MPEVISELIVTLDMKARGERSPGYYGYMGPELGAYFKKMSAQPHRTLMGRKTYELLNDLPEDAKDDGWRRTTEQPGYLFSKTLKKAEWPGLELVSEDMVEFVRKLKQRGRAGAADPWQPLSRSSARLPRSCSMPCVL